ncbi:LacI family DNA-binding transcriptional regulator [Microbacterium sp. 179-I 3D3 NHS]|uniref:LacI family DNA-binding transcriptional regulator n=1 Tax=unclassified Microbacterium TaxID=2609290 RepID=UPI0039A0F81E
MVEARRKAVGIRDVATAAGVSTATVSQVYNRKGEVAEATKARVLAAGERLGYRPNPLGQALRSGRSRIIGVVVSYRDSAVWEQTYMPYYRSIIAGAAIEAVEHGYAIAATPSTPDGRLAANVALDGMIVVDPIPGDPVVEHGLADGLTVVTDGGYPHAADETRLVSVRSDMDSGITAILDHVRESATGDFRPALFVGPRIDSYTGDTIAAFEGWCDRNGCTPALTALTLGQAPLDAARALLSAPERPTSVHCLNETYSSAVLEAAVERGLLVPTDLQVSTVGNARAVGAQPGVAYLDIDPVETGAVCARALIALLEGEAAADVVQPITVVPARWA